LWVNINLASRYTEGSATAIQYGFALMLLPLNFIAQAIATASLPTFSEQFALGKTDEMRNSISSAIRSILLLSIPASIGLIVLRFPIIRFLYEGGGAFTTQDTRLVAWALLWYAAGLVGHSVLEIVVRAFYAQHDTKTPVLIGAGAMALNIGLSILLAWLFNQIGWMPHGGLALANSIATALEISILLWLMRYRLNGIGGGKIWSSLWRSLIAAVVMGGLLLWFLNLGQGFTPLVQLVGGLVIGVVIYGGLAYLLKIDELTLVVVLLKRKVFGKK
jgi:putative peptidoglycan lipid II flippase